MMSDAILHRMREVVQAQRSEPNLHEAMRVQKALGLPPIPNDGPPTHRQLADSGASKMRQPGALAATFVPQQLVALRLVDDIKRFTCRQRNLFEKHLRRTLAIGIEQAVELVAATPQPGIDHAAQVIAAAVLSMQVHKPVPRESSVIAALASQIVSKHVFVHEPKLAPMRGAYVLSHAAIREEQPAKGSVIDARTVLRDMLTTYSQDAVESAGSALTLTTPMP